MGVVFVFGSNRQGRHGKGAARTAVRKYGAIYGQCQGRQGDSYAIITKELRKGFPMVSLQEIAHQVKVFLEYAKEHPDDEFQVVAIGCGLAGYQPFQIAPMFKSLPDNVKLPLEFEKVLAK